MRRPLGHMFWSGLSFLGTKGGDLSILSFEIPSHKSDRQIPTNGRPLPHIYFHRNRRSWSAVGDAIRRLINTTSRERREPRGTAAIAATQAESFRDKMECTSMKKLQIKFGNVGEQSLEILICIVAFHTATIYILYSVCINNV